MGRTIMKDGFLQHLIDAIASLLFIGRERSGQLAEKFRERIADHRFGSVGRITCSFGVTQFVDEDDFFRFTRRVDDIQYRAKAL